MPAASRGGDDAAFEIPAGETAPIQVTGGAEGATAPETLRQTDRGGDGTLESRRRRIAAVSPKG